MRRLLASLAPLGLLMAPLFGPGHELGISRVIAVSETQPCPADAAAHRMLSPHVTRRFRGGQTFGLFAEVYPAASPGRADGVFRAVRVASR